MHRLQECSQRVHSVRRLYTLHNSVPVSMAGGRSSGAGAAVGRSGVVIRRRLNESHQTAGGRTRGEAEDLIPLGPITIIPVCSPCSEGRDEMALRHMKTGKHCPVFCQTPVMSLLVINQMVVGCQRHMASIRGTVHRLCSILTGQRMHPRGDDAGIQAQT